MTARIDIGLDQATNDLPRIDLVEEIDGLPLLIQRLRNETTLYLTEWYLDLTRGLPLREWLQQKNPNRTAALALLEDSYRAIPGVRATADASATFGTSTRLLTFRVTVIADDGAIIDVTVDELAPARAANTLPFVFDFLVRSAGGF